MTSLLSLIQCAPGAASALSFIQGYSQLCQRYHKDKTVAKIRQPSPRVVKMGGIRSRTFYHFYADLTRVEKQIKLEATQNIFIAATQMRTFNAQNLMLGSPSLSA